MFKTLKHFIKEFLKGMFLKISPTYRTAHRIETKLEHLNFQMPNPTVFNKRGWERTTLLANMGLELSCLALEIHETHRAAFSEFRECHTGQDVVVVATGPSMKYYRQLEGLPHIGVNAAYKRQDITLDYYFMNDYDACCHYLDDLKNYSFIKFIGQFSEGLYKNKLQAPENFIKENHARRFFPGTPSEDIHINIEYYPMMGFYSVVFQAIHFALYTNPKRIYLVGCDCSQDGYFDGSKLNDWAVKSGAPLWLKGYKALKDFTQRFYPNLEIISVNPVGLRGMFRDVYTSDYLADHPEFDTMDTEILDSAKYKKPKNIQELAD